MSSYAVTHEYGRAFISCTLINHAYNIHSIGYYDCSVSVLVEIITKQTIAISSLSLVGHILYIS